MKKLWASIGMLLLSCAAALAQSGQNVRQSGNVTPGHLSVWTSNGVVGDGGTASTPANISSIGVVGSGPTICTQSAATSSGNYNRTCIGSTSTAGLLTLDNIGSATGGFEIRINGVTQGFPTVTLPVTADDFACFANTTGGLKDCGTSPISAGSSIKAPVTVATDGSNITLSGEQTIDGVLTSATRVLVKDQTTASQNGIYISSSGAWSRSSDFATAGQVVQGTQVTVTQGTTNHNITYFVATTNPITIGSSSISFISGVHTWQTGAGTVAGSYQYNNMKIYTDGINAGANAVVGLNFDHYFGNGPSGALTQGGRGAGLFNLFMAGTTSASNSNRNYTALGGQFVGQYNDRGTAPSPAGAGFGFNSTAVLCGTDTVSDARCPAGAATNWLNITSYEADIVTFAGSSTKQRSGISIVDLGSAVQGSTYDAALSISATRNGGVSVVGFKNGILFSKYNSENPLSTNGCLICTSDAATAAIGLDTSSYTLANWARIGNNQPILYRNAASNADVVLLNLDGSNNVILGGTGNSGLAFLTAALLPGADNTYALGNSSLRWSALHAVGVDVYGASSGVVTIVAQATGGGTVTLPSASGTVAVNASSPLVLSATTGALTCPTCATTAGASIPAIAQGDLLYGSAANTLSALAKNTSATRYLSNTGASNNPAWAPIDLSNGVTSTLACANGGTGLSSGTTGGLLGFSAACGYSTVDPVAVGRVLVSAGTGTLPVYSATPTLGASGTAGSIAFGNATSGTVTVQTVAGALGTVTLSLPAATDTLVGKATTDELTNKTLTSSVGKGTWTASGTWTLPAVTLGGTVSGGGNQLNNIIIGTSTPLAGTFTTATATLHVANTATNVAGVSVVTTGSANAVMNMYDTTAGGIRLESDAGMFAVNASNTSGAYVRQLMTIAGGAAGTITFNGSDYTTCSSLTTVANVLTCTPSSIRFKNPIGDLGNEKASHTLEKLHAVVWSYKNPKKNGEGEFVGLYAEDVERMDARCAMYDPDGKLHDYRDRCIIAYLVDSQNSMRTELAALKRSLGK